MFLPISPVADLGVEARRLTASGRSTLGSTGAANWVITNKVDGGKLSGVEQFQKTMEGKRAACEAYLDGIYKQFVTKYVALKLREPERPGVGLYHGDATDSELWQITPLYLSLIPVPVRFRQRLFQRQQ